MEMIAQLPLQGLVPVGRRPAAVRPYALSGARLRPAASGGGEFVPSPRPTYDPARQIATFPDGTPLTAMATSVKTNPDGDHKNPPPHDEGADPGVFE
jgi:putative ATP-grasp target RiPP